MRTKPFPVPAAWMAVLIALLAGMVIPGSLLSAQQKSPRATELYLPQEHGIIEETYEGKADRLVVCIQDAHVNATAQQNIATIIQKLHDTYGIRLVGVEGSSGMVNTALFRAFPGKESKELVSTSLMQEGKISGAEYASIHSSKPLQLFGMEDPQLYLTHYDSLVGSATLRKEAIAALAELGTHLTLLKQKLYSARLKEWEIQWEEYSQRKTPFREMVRLLIDQAKEHGVPTQGYEHLALYRTLLELETTLDFPAVDEQRQEAVSNLSKRLESRALKDFTQTALQYRVGRLSPLEFHRRLLKLLSGHQLGYPGLSQYMEYLELSSRVDRDELSSEMETLGTLVFDSISDRKGVQQRTRTTARDIALLERFLKLRASHGDYRFYLGQRDRMDVSRIYSNVRELSKVAEVPFNLSMERMDVVSKALPRANKFYEIASRRDGVLASNLTAEMERTGDTMSVLLAGGFHTDGILQYLRGRGISYVVILPKVGDASMEDRYLALLLRSRTPFLDLYRKKQKTDVLSGTIGWVPPGPRKSSKAMAINTFFRDAIEKWRFKDRKNDFTYEYVSLLLSVARVINEVKGEADMRKWETLLEDGLKGLLGPEQRAAVIADREFLNQIPAFGPMVKVNDKNFYVPVEIDGVVVMHNFYDALKDTVIGDMGMVYGPLEIAPGVPHRAMDYKVFTETVVGALSEKISPVKHVPAPLRKDKRVIARDIDKVGVDADDLVGLAKEWKLLRERDPDMQRVLVTALALEEYEKNLKILGMEKGIHYDAIVGPEFLRTTGQWMAQLQDALPSVLPDWRGDATTDLVVITRRPEAFGQRGRDHKIQGTPVVVPEVSSQINRVPSERMILYFAQLILDYGGDLSALAASLKAGGHAGLKVFLEEQGVGVDEESLRGVLHNPMPVKVSPDVGEEFKAHSQFLQAA